MAVVWTALTSELTDKSSNLTGLGNGDAKSIAIVDFSAGNSPEDLVFRVESKTNASGVDSSGSIELYVLVKNDADDWTDGIDPTVNTDLASSIKNARLLQPLVADADSLSINIYRYCLEVLNAIPEQVAIIALNKTGATLSATGGDHTLSAWKVEAA